jgi:cytochrome c553
MPRLGPFAFIVCALTAAPALSQPAPPVAPLSVKETMRHVVNPAAELFWKNSGSVSTEAGVEERAPSSDAVWAEMVNAAAIVQAAGELLETPGHGPDDPVWRGFARQLATAGAASIVAARAKDGDKAFETGGEMYNACFNCHGRYIPRPKNSLWKQP